MISESGSLIIPDSPVASKPSKRRKNSTVFLDEHGLPMARPGSDTMVIPMPLDPKETKGAILNNWQAYSAAEVVKMLRQLYSNVGSLSSQLSLLKSTLANLPDPPPAEYLEKIKLTPAEYRLLNDNYRAARDKEGFNLTVVHDADKLVAQALEMITSSDFRVLWPAAVLCCGLRPVELLTVNFRPPQTKHGAHDGWWVCVSGWAKKGQVKTAKRDFCRDHPLLCPTWLFLRAIKLIRDHFNKETLTKRQLHQRYAKYWLSLLAKGFPQLVQPTHVLFRRFYAKYSFLYFNEDFPNVIGENSFITWVLGHSSVEPALSYTNLHLRNAGKMKLFDIGRGLTVPAVEPPKPTLSLKHKSPHIKRKTSSPTKSTASSISVKVEEIDDKHTQKSRDKKRASHSDSRLSRVMIKR